MTEDEFRNLNRTVTIFHTAFGEVRVVSGKISPITILPNRDPFARGEVMIGETELQNLYGELWKNGFSLKEIVVEKEICPTCKRPL